MTSRRLRYESKIMERSRLLYRPRLLCRPRERAGEKLRQKRPYSAGHPARPATRGNRSRARASIAHRDRRRRRPCATAREAGTPGPGCHRASAGSRPSRAIRIRARRATRPARRRRTRRAFALAATRRNRCGTRMGSSALRGGRLPHSLRARRRRGPSPTVGHPSMAARETLFYHEHP